MGTRSTLTNKKGQFTKKLKNLVAFNLSESDTVYLWKLLREAEEKALEVENLYDDLLLESSGDVSPKIKKEMAKAIAAQDARINECTGLLLARPTVSLPSCTNVGPPLPRPAFKLVMELKPHLLSSEATPPDNAGLDTSVPKLQLDLSH
jgi:hypothetical protein